MSTFVSPLALTGHTVWTYSGPGLTGYANPEGKEVAADSRETLMLAAVEALSDSPSEHVVAMGDSLSEMVRSLRFELPPSRRVVRPVSEPDLPRLPQRVRRVVSAWLTINYVAAWAGASWMLVEGGVTTSVHMDVGEQAAHAGAGSSP
jgi:hypothetical protein